MSRRVSPIAVTRKSEIEGLSDLNIEVKNTPARVFLSLVKAGHRGITCRDWHGYDLRHHLRVLRNLGIGIDREWEKHEGGQHGRWRLRAGHSYQEIEVPKKAKPSAAATVKASNSQIGSENNLRRIEPYRRSQVQTYAQRSLSCRYGISLAHARVITELQGYGVGGVK